MLQKYNKDSCLKDLKKYCLNHNTCQVKELKQEQPSLYNALIKYHGGLVNALNLIDMSSKSYRLLPILKTREEWGHFLQEIYKKYNKVTMSLIQKERKYSCKNFTKVVGSMESILLEYNIPLTVGQRKMISKEELDIELKRIEHIFGYCSKPLLEKHSHINPKVVNRIYGSFDNMYKELNIKRSNSGIVPTDEELIEDVKRIYNEYNVISKQIIAAESKYSATCYNKRLGGINNIYNILNIKPCKQKSEKNAMYVIKKYEKYLKEKPILEKTFDWLYNPKTNKKLRIDAYFPESKIALEYNGPQHYMIDKRYTTSKDMLTYRQELDRLKITLLQEHDINVITVHYKDIVTEDYIKKSLVF